jgi:type II secretory pathway component GspD/PulD (secretin)
MQKISKFLTVVLVVILSGCAGVKNSTIPLKEKVILSREDIVNLEEQEAALAQQRYDEELKKNARPANNQPLVSNVYTEMSLREVLLDISDISGVNILPDYTVEGTVSATLENIPLETALEMALSSGEYDYKYIEGGEDSPGYYIVGSSSPESSSFVHLADVRTVKTNQNAEEIMKKLSHFEPYMSAEGQVITITATEKIAEKIELAIIKEADLTKRQIEISAQFIMVEWDKGTSIGMEWSDLDLGAMGIGNLLSAGTNVFNLDLASSLGGFLKANGYSAKVSTLAEPRIIVEEGGVGELNITEEHLFLILSGGGAAYNYFTTKEVEVGIKMKVKPYISRNGEIRLEVNPEIAEIVGEREFKSGDGPSQKLPIIARRSTSTILNLENGETIAMGGLITKTEIEKKSGIPVLRSIPVVGIVFGRKNTKEKESELVILIQPNIVR